MRPAQGICILLIVAGIAVLVASIGSTWAGMQTTCYPVRSCQQYQLDPASASVLSQHGISLRDYAAFMSAVLATTSLVWFALAVLIIRRRPDDRGALAAAFFLVLFPQFELGFLTGWGAGAGSWIGFAALLLFALLFPDGRFNPTWARWVAILAVLSVAALGIPAIGSGGLFFFWVIPIFLLPGLVVWVQIHRYRKASSWGDRQRSKWAFLGLITGILSLLAIFVSSVFVPGSQHSSGMDAGGLYGIFATVAIAVLPLAIPVSIAIAILRSRLWDVDRVISRALVYIALTLSLVGTYIGGVIGLQALFGLVVGNSSTPAIVLSTLAIAALFGPLRRRIQVIIDRRFYRAKYDAGRTLAAFSERLRDQVDLERLSHDLSSAVGEALHPEHVSIWLRE